MTAYSKLLEDIEKSETDVLCFNDKLIKISPRLKQEIKNEIKISNKDALEKLLYLSFRFPWIITNSAFDWYPHVFYKTLKELQKGAYRDALRNVLNNLSKGIKSDPKFLKNRGRPINQKNLIIKLIQGNLIKYSGSHIPSDFRGYFRAKKKFKGRLYPILSDYGLSFNPETEVFDKKGDENLYEVYKWLDIGVRIGYLTPTDTNNIVSIFITEDSGDETSGKDTYTIPNNKLIEIKKIVKIFLKQRC